MSNKAKIAIAHNFPNGENLQSLFEIIKTEAKWHVLGAPAKKVFAKETTEPEKGHINILVPSAINIQSPMVWSLSETATENTFAVYVNKEGFSTPYVPYQSQYANIWPEKPFEKTTIKYIDEKTLISAINKVLLACHECPYCLTFALGLMIVLCAPDKMPRQLQAFHSTSDNEIVTFMNKYALMTDQQLMTTTNLFATQPHKIIKLLDTGYIIQLRLPATTQMLTAERTWRYISTPHITSFLKLDDGRIICADNNACIKYSEQELRYLLNSRPVARTKVEQLWYTMVQGNRPH